LIKELMESDERDKDRGKNSSSPSISFGEAKPFGGLTHPLPGSRDRDNDNDKYRGTSLSSSTEILWAGVSGNAEVAPARESDGSAWAKAFAGNAINAVITAK
jgi:hypothetical protein